MPPLSPISLNPRTWSVRARLMAWNIGLVAVIVGALGALALVSIRAALLGAVDRGLSDRAHHFHGAPPPPRMGADAGPQPFSPMAPPGPPPGFGPPRRPVMNDPYRPRDLDLAGHSTSPDSRQGPWDRAAFERAAAGTEQFSTVTFDDEPVRVVSEPMRRGGRVVGVTQMAQPLDETLRAIAGVRQTLLALVPAALLLAGLGGAAVTGRALRPVRDITEAADRIGARDLSQRLPVPSRSSDEFSRLAATFNGMLARLDEAFDEQRAMLEQQKRFTADASHELKTPLAAAKVHADLLLQPGATAGEARESAQDIRRALDRMSRLVRDLLVLARHDAAPCGQLRGATDVMVRDILEQARCDVLARQKQAGGRPPVRVLAPDACITVFGSEPDLVRLFSNLLDNAVRHTPPEGEVRAAARAEGEAVVIAVSDNGSGIAPEHLPHLGERFYRVDAARARFDSDYADGGSGLGLAICRGIAEAHGGALRFDSAPGRGTTVTVALPRRPPA